MADMYQAVLRPKQLVVNSALTTMKKDQIGIIMLELTLEFIGPAKLPERNSLSVCPRAYTIYSNGYRFELMGQLKIVPDQNGEVELLSPFWNEEVFSRDGDTVPPLLAYAELISSFDSRNLETAMRVKEKYVK